MLNFATVRFFECFISLAIFCPGLTGLWKRVYRIVVSLSPEARDIAGQSRDPRMLPHSCMRPDMLPLLSLAVEASFCEFSSKTGALSAKSGPAENSRSVISEASWEACPEWAQHRRRGLRTPCSKVPRWAEIPQQGQSGERKETLTHSGATHLLS